MNDNIFDELGMDSNNAIATTGTEQSDNDIFDEFTDKDIDNMMNPNESGNSNTSTISGADSFKYGKGTFTLDKLQLDGINRKPVKTVAQAQQELRSISPEEQADRKSNSASFEWVGTLVDKAIPDTKETKKKGTVKYFKNIHFLRWIVTTRQSNGERQYMTQDDVLSYFTNKCDMNSFILGDPTKDTALQITYSQKKPSKNVQQIYDAKPVFGIEPAREGMSKYDESKIVEAKEPIYENGKPKRHLNVKFKSLPAGITSKDDLDPDLHPDYFYTMYKTKDEFLPIIGSRSSRSKAQKEETNRLAGATMLKVLYSM